MGKIYSNIQCEYEKMLILSVTGETKIDTPMRYDYAFVSNGLKLKWLITQIVKAVQQHKLS